MVLISQLSVAIWVTFSDRFLILIFSFSVVRRDYSSLIKQMFSISWMKNFFHELKRKPG